MKRILLALLLLSCGAGGASAGLPWNTGNSLPANPYWTKTYYMSQGGVGTTCTSSSTCGTTAAVETQMVADCLALTPTCPAVSATATATNTTSTTVAVPTAGIAVGWLINGSGFGPRIVTAITDSSHLVVDSAITTTSAVAYTFAAPTIASGVQIMVTGGAGVFDAFTFNYGGGASVGAGGAITTGSNWLNVIGAPTGGVMPNIRIAQGAGPANAVSFGVRGYNNGSGIVSGANYIAFQGFNIVNQDSNVGNICGFVYHPAPSTTVLGVPAAHHISFVGNRCVNFGSNAFSSAANDYVSVVNNVFVGNAYALTGSGSAIVFDGPVALAPADPNWGYHFVAKGNVFIGNGAWQTSAGHTDGNDIILDFGIGDQNNTLTGFSQVNGYMLEDNASYYTGGRSMWVFQSNGATVRNNVAVFGAKDPNFVVAGGAIGSRASLGLGCGACSRPAGQPSNGGSNVFYNNVSVQNVAAWPPFYDAQGQGQFFQPSDFWTGNLYYNTDSTLPSIGSAYLGKEGFNNNTGAPVNPGLAIQTQAASPATGNAGCWVLPVSVTTTSGSPNVTLNVADSNGCIQSAPGGTITGAVAISDNFANGSYVTTRTDSTHFILTKNATASSTVTAWFINQNMSYDVARAAFVGSNVSGGVRFAFDNPFRVIPGLSAFQAQELPSTARNFGIFQ